MEQTDYFSSRNRSFFTTSLLAGWALCAGFGATPATAQADVQPTHNTLPAISAALFTPAPLFPESSSSSVADAASDALPEAPQAQVGDPKTAHGTAPSQRIARADAEIIPAGWTAQRLTVGQKIRVGAKDLYSFDNLAAVIVSAGYSHVTNGQPNYGTDKGAFGERLGAAAIRETSQGVFTDMVFGPLLHEDTRTYIEGPTYSPVHRTLYAITRPLVTRKDSGGYTVNGALLLGYAASAALTPSFYPSINRNFHDTAATYGGSIGGAALGFFVSEFSNDVLYALHLRRQP